MWVLFMPKANPFLLLSCKEQIDMPERAQIGSQKSLVFFFTRVLIQKPYEACKWKYFNLHIIYIFMLPGICAWISLFMSRTLIELCSTSLAAVLPLNK